MTGLKIYVDLFQDVIKHKYLNFDICDCLILDNRRIQRMRGYLDLKEGAEGDRMKPILMIVGQLSLYYGNKKVPYV